MRRTFIIILTLITTVIHIYYFSTDPKGGTLYILFLLNALGYVALLGLLYLPLGLPASLEQYVRPIFIGYTALTILLYVILSAPSGMWEAPWAPLSKVVEALMIWQLWAEGKGTRQPAIA